MTLRYDLGGGITPFTELPKMAVGGTMSIRPHCDTPAFPEDCDHTCLAAWFDLPYDVESRDSPVRFTGFDENAKSPSPATFYAAEPGNGTVAFVRPADGSIYAEVATRASEIDHIELFGLAEVGEPGVETVFATQQRGPEFPVFLLGAAGEYLVDHSMSVTLSGVEQTFPGVDLHGMPSGTYAVGVKAGGKTFTESIVIVNEADTLEVFKAPTTVPQTMGPWIPPEYVCFHAKNAGRLISGLCWKQFVDGVQDGSDCTESCVQALTDKPRGSPVTFTAEAGGQSITIQIPAR